MNDSQTRTPGPARNPRRRRWLGLGLAAGLGSVLTLGLLGGHAMSHGWSRHGGFGHGQVTLEQLQSRLDQVLDRIDADDSQRQRIGEILGAAWRDLQGTADRHRDNRRAMLELLQAPEIDRAGLRALRDDEMDLVSGASNRLVEAVADAAEVLTPAQRRSLAEQIERHRH